MKKTVFLLLVTLLTLGANAQNTGLSYFVGSWKATLLTMNKTDATMVIAIKDGKLSGNLITSSETRPMSSLTVKDSNMSFTCYDSANDIYADFYITFDKKADTFKGLIMGTYTIEGSRIKKE